MAKQQLTDDGLPIISKSKSNDSTTDDGLPILKKKGPTPSVSLNTQSPFPSTNSNPLAGFDSSKLKDNAYDPVNNPYPEEDYTRGVKPKVKEQKQVREVEDIKSSVKPWEKGFTLNTGEEQMVQDATANVDRTVNPKIQGYERTVNKEGISVLKPKFVDERVKQKNLTDADLKRAKEFDEGVESYGAEFVQGALGGVAQMAKGLSLAYVSLFDTETNPYTGTKRIKDGKKLEDYGAYKLGSIIDTYVRENFDQDERAGNILNKVASGAGSMVPFVLGGAAGKALKFGEFVAPATMGMFQNGASQYEDAINNGADNATAMKAYWQGMAIGSLEGVPIGLWARKLDKASGGKFNDVVAETLKKRKRNLAPGVVETGIEGLQEGAQEFSTAVLNNASAMTLYDETRKLLDTAFEDGGVGFLLGAILNGTTNALQRRKNDPNLSPAEKVQIEKSIQYAENIQSKMADVKDTDFVKPTDDSPEVQELKEKKVQLESDIADPNIAPEIKEQVAQKVEELDAKIEETKAAQVAADSELVAKEGEVAELEATKTALEEQAVNASETTKNEILQPQIDDFISQIEALKAELPAQKTTAEEPSKEQQLSDIQKRKQEELANLELVPLSLDGEKTNAEKEQDKKIEEINAKYEAEINALQEQPVKNESTQGTEEKAADTEVSETPILNDVESTSKALEFDGAADNELQSMYDELSASKNPDVRKLSNMIENVQEKRERNSILNVALDKVSEVIDNIFKKDSYFLEKREGREAKQVAKKYSGEVSSEEAKKDFKDSFFGNPNNWVADAIKMRESVRVFAENGGTFKDLLKGVQQEFNNDGFTEQEAAAVIKNKLESITKKDFRQNQISEAYHKAKKDGSNPELVSAVEKILQPTTEKNNEKPTTKPKKPTQSSSSESVPKPVSEGPKGLRVIDKKQGKRGETGKTARGRRKLTGVRKTASEIPEENLKTPREKALHYFASGGTVSRAAIKSLINNSELEAKKRINLIGGDLSTQGVAHEIWMNNLEDTRYSERDYVDAVEQVLNDYTHPKNMAEELVEAHEGVVDENAFKEYQFQRQIQEYAEQQAKETETVSLTDPEISEIVFQELSKMSDSEIQALADGKDAVTEQMARDIVEQWWADTAIDEDMATPWDQEPEMPKGKMDKVIDALEKAKIDTKGKALDATLGIPISIYNSAIDVIIGAIKVGESINSALEKALQYLEENYDDFGNSEYSGFTNQILSKVKSTKLKPNEIIVYHGGVDISEDTIDDNRQLFVTENEREAKLYAQQDQYSSEETSVYQFVIDKTKLASEKQAKNILKEIDAKPGEDGYTIDELNIHELIDDKFGTAIPEKDRQKLVAELKKQGYEGVEFTDFSANGTSDTSTNIVLFNPKKSLYSNMSKTSLADAAIDALNSLKFDTKGTLNAFGLIPATWNTALDIIISAVKAGKAVSEAIADAVKYIKSTNPESFDEKGFTDKIESLYKKPEPKQETKTEKEEKSEPKQEKKEEPKQKSKASPGSKKLKLAKRVLASDEVSNDIKEGLEKEGTNYIPISLSISQQEAKAYVETFEENGALDEAFENVMDMTNGMAGVTRGHIALELFDIYAKQARTASDIQSKVDADAKAAKLAKLAAVNFKAAGQEINAAKAWKKLLNNTPEGAVAELTNQYAEQNEPIIEPQRKNIRDAKKDLEEFLLSEEGQEMISKEVDKEIDKRSESILGKEGRKKVVDFFDSLLIKTNGKLFDATFALPVAVYNGAIKAMKQAVLLGADVATAIKAGVEYVSKNHSGNWKQKEFELTMQEGLKSVVPRKKYAPKKQTTEKILDKWASRLGKLNPDQRKKLLAKSIDELNTVGALSDARFEQFYAEALGLPTMTEEVKKNIYDLINTINDVDTAFDELKKVNRDPEATQKQTKEAKEKYLKAVRQARNANDALSDYFRKEKNIWETFTTIMQGNLLAPFSLVQNVWSNIAFSPLRFMSGGVASMFDYVMSQAAKHKLLSKYIKEGRTTDVIERTKGGFNGLAPGIKEGYDDLLHGLTSDEAKERDLNNKLQPLKSAANLWATYFGDKKMTANAQLNAWAEVLFGIPADIMFRLLNLGDKPFRKTAEVGKAFEIAKTKGLKGIELQEFLLKPDEESAAEIKAAGDAATFQEDNRASKVVNNLQAQAKSIPAVGNILSFLMKVLVPYVKTPTNIIGKTINYAIPPLTLARSIYYAKEGDRKKSLEYFGEAVVGTMLGYIALSALQNGLLSGTGDDDDPKEKAIQYENVPPKSLNLSAMKRGLSGQGFATKDDDVWIDYTKTGIMGNIIGMYANMGAEETQEAIKQLKMSEVMIKGIPTIIKTSFDQSYLKGTSALLEAFNEGGSKVDRLIVNMVGAIGSVPLPNTIASLSKSSDTVIRNIKGEDLGQDIVNMFKQKMFMYNDLPSKITLWGEKVSNAPEGRNKYLYNMFDITKFKNVSTDNFGFKIYDKWNKSKDADWLPSLPKQTLTHNGQDIKLTPSQYEKYLEWIGKERKSLVKAYVDSPNWELNTDEMNQKVLKALYETGREIGKINFINSNPDVIKQTTDK